jgi:hypothetical protein
VIETSALDYRSEPLAQEALAEAIVDQRLVPVLAHINRKTEFPSGAALLAGFLPLLPD